MHITVSRINILGAVQRCQNVVERRHTVPILSNILLSAEGGVLMASATDLEVGIRAQVQASVDKAGQTTVAARKLFDVLKELDADADVELKLEDGFLRIASGRSRFRLATMAADDFPDIQDDSGGVEVRLEGLDLAAMIASTSFAMSTDETRKYLTGTLFELDAAGLNLVATDGHRLALIRRLLTEPDGSCKSIVPRKAVMEIRKLCEDEPGQVALCIGERQIRVNANVCTLVSKLIDARFPNYADVIPVDNPELAVANRTELDQILRRIMIVANEFTHDVRLLLRPGEMVVSAHNTDQEQAEETLALEYAGPETEIGFNARYIRDVLGVMKGDVVRVHFRDGLSPVLLDEGEDAAARFVIMPMRI